MEIGPGSTSILYSKNFGEHLLKNPNAHYICIDINKNYLEKIKKESFLKERYKDKFSCLIAKGEELPFKDGIIDQIVLQNIFSDSALGIENPRMVKIACFSDSIQKHIEQIKAKILEEITRTLKTKGILIIIDFNTKEVSQDFFNKEEIKKYLKENFEECSKDMINKYKELFLLNFAKKEYPDFFAFQKKTKK